MESPAVDMTISEALPDQYKMFCDLSSTITPSTQAKYFRALYQRKESTSESTDKSGGVNTTTTVQYRMNKDWEFAQVPKDQQLWSKYIFFCDLLETELRVHSPLTDTYSMEKGIRDLGSIPAHFDEFVMSKEDCIPGRIEGEDTFNECCRHFHDTKMKEICEKHRRFLEIMTVRELAHIWYVTPSPAHANHSITLTIYMILSILTFASASASCSFDIYIYSTP